ncbi:heat domain-containing protein (plasmid) [Thalassoporum mexicanum PCC 7367]|uniref:HEAT repeat domain-containing protein n=1 Tax=Thalassoporum mexicanum TaxID=3457544 RepID=UPI00029F9AC8|nr:HEAT repeat domain-containing protein [Pseudanabaena sp. PCC 7367]AFY72114.1 heat domain-containing protein [Pseudanabaena sp. PCC 7367]
MNIQQIETDLKHPDFHYRIKAIAALRDFPAEVAVPLLREHHQDREFLVRSFVARELGRQKIPASFELLLQMMLCDDNPNVRAEAANSVSLFEDIAPPHLVQSFARDDNWLVRRSILGALADMQCVAELLAVSQLGIAGEDLSVKGTSIAALATLAKTEFAAAALELILANNDSTVEYVRIRVAHALRAFDAPEAREALAQLRQDESHRVVGAALEGLLPQDV